MFSDFAEKLASIARRFSELAENATLERGSARENAQFFSELAEKAWNVASVVSEFAENAGALRLLFQQTR